MAMRILNSAVSNHKLFRRSFIIDTAKKYGAELSESTLLISENDIKPSDVPAVAKHYDWAYKMKDQAFIDSSIVQGRDFCVLFRLQASASVMAEDGGMRPAMSYDRWYVYNAKTGRLLSTTTGPTYRPATISPRLFKKIQKVASKGMK